RRTELQAELGDTGDGPLQSELEALLARQPDCEQRLSAARDAVAEQESVETALERQRVERGRELDALRQRLEALRLEAGEARVHCRTLAEQLAELEQEPAAMLAGLPAGAEEAQWQRDLEQVTARVQRLGAVNLAAIEEHAQLSERKCHLDRQDADLRDALETLEVAMARIDRDTRSRFRETFERINEQLGILFPRLFGGGKAFLQLTEDDPLEAGVTLMAQPPGKRVGRIQLLSGGEKALTALALVFAIFQLNPAPFCMLDEVDAPLDEANVGRFGRLVEEMAEQVQFIIVTHNKTTMAITQHLAGVTMHEPGVSRLVTVDVDEAVRLAAV
ncbi:MAG: hypothetical protein R3202_12255, partial [Candidatus Competibacterales bacterium]|nr:hypothetical protein [Candidatus Competibacterales bacterium]